LSEAGRFMMFWMAYGAGSSPSGSRSIPVDYAKAVWIFTPGKNASSRMNVA
jgi:hypothetical protein